MSATEDGPRNTVDDPGTDARESFSGLEPSPFWLTRSPLVGGPDAACAIATPEIRIAAMAIAIARLLLCRRIRTSVCNIHFQETAGFRFCRGISKVARKLSCNGRLVF